MLLTGNVDSRLLAYAEQSAPRYTSYPTAPHFEPAVNGEVFGRWLGELAPDASVSLYLHSPYCQQMCFYCGCHAFLAKRDEPIADYVEAIVREIETVARASGAKRVEEIHWGGGTPNTLNAERFEHINAVLRREFDLSSVARHAIEIDPRILSRDQAQAFARCGVNRASLGVQDLDPQVQASIGRVQPLEVVAEAVGHLREAGIDALSFDLMYGLPDQTVESVKRTAEQALALQPARFSVFGYAHVPWFKTRQRLMNADALPGAAQRFELAETIRDTLAAAGYVEIGYDHYARPDDPIAVAASAGALQRNFQGFVEHACDALIGLGPSAISTLPQGYAQNEPEVGAWRTAVMDGIFATKRGRALTAEDRLRRELIMRLLCDFRLDLGPYGGAAAYQQELEELSLLARDGLVVLSGDLITIPAEARAFARLAAQAFDAYRQQAPARHSAAV
ncbi:MAG: oxygen-independent coproporphyrinogen III oxidase [Hyphomonadaceae bacterium]|nr:oxygen-independent coproporphyrinogen III oxidase [Hyphomonadaceae bacterium]